ncbi:MAG: hypothetical protein MZU95_05600 [Desulfomicrobium escambiense]|nr:hypothetical protein [Desulfomicrobium escambiense]
MTLGIGIIVRDQGAEAAHVTLLGGGLSLGNKRSDLGFRRGFARASRQRQRDGQPNPKTRCAGEKP